MASGAVIGSEDHPLVGDLFVENGGLARALDHPGSDAQEKLRRPMAL